MDISPVKYTKLLIAAGIIMYIYINHEKQKQVNSIPAEDKISRNLEKKWGEDEWMKFIIGCLFGAPLIDGLVSGIYYLFQ